MSYILEALRKAQAERERGQVPGLEARPVVNAEPAPSQASNRLVLGLAVGLVLAVLVAALLWGQPTKTAPGPMVLPPVPSTLPASAASAPVAPVASALSLPMVVSAPPVPAVSIPAVPTPAAASTPPAVLRLAQMAPEQRRQLPPLAIGGSMWSENAASRFVIIDGQVLREGDAVAPGLLLERIAAKSAWLRWRDSRIEINF